MICLFCKNDRPESQEHVFAAPFGTVNFVVTFVCKPCNDLLGNQVDYLADRDARLSHARQSAGLMIRHQTIQTTDPVIEADGTKLRTVFDKRELASVVAPQRDGEEIAVGRDLMADTIRQTLRAKFRKEGHAITTQEVEAFTAEAIDKFDKAAAGETVTHTYRGATVHIPRIELPNDTTRASRYDEPGAICRVSGKIAMEVAAHAFGMDVLLRDQFDQTRAWVISGDPDLDGRVEVAREPSLSGRDAEREHTVHLRDEHTVLVADIAYYNAYEVRVPLGPAIGIKESWSRRFPIEDK